MHNSEQEQVLEKRLDDINELFKKSGFFLHKSVLHLLEDAELEKRAFREKLAKFYELMEADEGVQ
jgi:hypothetical protein